MKKVLLSRMIGDPKEIIETLSLCYSVQLKNAENDNDLREYLSLKLKIKSLESAKEFFGIQKICYPENPFFYVSDENDTIEGLYKECSNYVYNAPGS